MKRVTWLPSLIIVVISLAIAGVTEKPPMAMAGGFPCWLCHGVNFEGSDLAPRVNGTKLTDAEILKQVHNPRGVMPAFDARDWPDDATIIQYIRSLPPAGPTKTLTNPECAAALSTIAAVARIRAMAAAAADYPTMTPSPVHSGHCKPHSGHCARERRKRGRSHVMATGLERDGGATCAVSNDCCPGLAARSAIGFSGARWRSLGGWDQRALVGIASISQVEIIVRPMAKGLVHRSI